MPVISTVRRLEAIEALARHFQRQPRASWNYRVNFALTRAYAVGRTQVGVAFSLHVVPPGGGPAGVFRSSVATWLPGRRRQSRQQGVWNAELRRVGWYDECERTLRTYGYRGSWRRSPWGRVGDFWRAHPDGASLVAEVERLTALSGEECWGRRATAK